MKINALSEEKAKYVLNLISAQLPQAKASLDSFPGFEDLEKLQNVLGDIPIPKDLLTVYSVFGSQTINEKIGGVVFNNYLLNPWVIAEQMIADKAVNDEYDSSNNLDPDDGRILSSYHPVRCVPFLADNLGNFFAIDFAPGQTGQVGQIVAYGADEDPKFIANSMDDFFDLLIWVLENRKFRIKLPFDPVEGRDMTISRDESVGIYSQSLATYLAILGNETKGGVELWKLLPVLWYEAD